MKMPRLRSTIALSSVAIIAIGAVAPSARGQGADESASRAEGDRPGTRRVEAQRGSDPPDVYMFASPFWAKRWAGNFRAAGRPPFGKLVVKAALTYPKSDSVDDVIEACRVLDAMHWPYVVGMSHFGQDRLEDWFEPAFWQRGVVELRRLMPLVGPDRLFVFDFEPYRLTGKRYPQLHDAYRLATGMKPLIDEIKAQKLRVGVLQGDLSHLYLWLLRANGIEVMLMDKGVDRAPYGLEGWQAKMVDRHRATRAAGMEMMPVFYAAALTPEFQRTISSMRLPLYGIFFAGTDQEDIPGASTREDYYHFGLPQWDPLSQKFRDRRGRP
jgi:hypothetical protein